MAASDYHELVRSILDSAKSGDPESQFLIYQALAYCDSGYRAYFDRRNSRRTLDEAMQWASTKEPVLMAEEAREIHGKCHALMEKSTRAELGESDDWLVAATNGAHPIAQATSATKLFTSAVVLELDEANLESQATLATQHRKEGVDLLTKALKSGEPEVLWMISYQQFAGDDDWAWRIAACQRGYDCGPNAAWHTQWCRFDPRTLCNPGETGMDAIRRETGIHFPAYEERATELNRLIDAGAWDEIPLVPAELQAGE